MLQHTILFYSILYYNIAIHIYNTMSLCTMCYAATSFSNLTQDHAVLYELIFCHIARAFRASRLGALAPAPLAGDFVPEIGSGYNT